MGTSTVIICECELVTGADDIPFAGQPDVCSHSRLMAGGDALPSYGVRGSRSGRWRKRMIPALAPRSRTTTIRTADASRGPCMTGRETRTESGHRLPIERERQQVPLPNEPQRPVRDGGVGRGETVSFLGRDTKGVVESGAASIRSRLATWICGHRRSSMIPSSVGTVTDQVECALSAPATRSCRLWPTAQTGC